MMRNNNYVTIADMEKDYEEVIERNNQYEEQRIPIKVQIEGKQREENFWFYNEDNQEITKTFHEVDFEENFTWMIND